MYIIYILIYYNNISKKKFRERFPGSIFFLSWPLRKNSPKSACLPTGPAKKSKNSLSKIDLAE